MADNIKGCRIGNDIKDQSKGWYRFDMREDVAEDILGALWDVQCDEPRRERLRKIKRAIAFTLNNH